ncbi:PepSY-associated TM helix domain-containing protein [Pseudoteredinibacter isoporae]|uniref:Putative iron-regulated membrane protein n=1 Tax=Pseudoteredinibacter isoporae TaxID=570281 RepID=A0A7X0MXV3_9GAMM|nr:PepSY-associated TM helix domain-containing protein [Pseudoteredinibacter isoporae]MBB6523605.1 putative iron-regulated membrane protein [Pseudoteredinibacter isoporae]NHO89112.1 PepSY domain-containing protein [Pseudoteredinibacter isoporae]NIB22277.1 PepSY domain-containing protein [Pseudoteredinibacter isoporae]
MIRNDIVRVYREVHSWVGILCGLFLFIAFYAGALSMFEESIQRWASPPLKPSHITPIEKTQTLIDRVITEHPSAGRNFNIVLQSSPDRPGRMHWEEREPGADDHALPTHFYADLSTEGELLIRKEQASPVAQLIDTLHQQVGILIDHELAMPITGIVSALYAIALVSGVIILLPTLVKDLFALRLGGKVKRMWLDVHNLLGVFSLPFHIIMALTAVVFALHDPFYGTQMVSIHADKKVPLEGPPAVSPPSENAPFYPVEKLIGKLESSAPEFSPDILNYRQTRGPKPKQMLFVMGKDPKHHASRPRHGLVSLDAYTGEILSTEYMPGQQEVLQATVSSFFALHFGNYGGAITQWLYFFLGLAGAFLFYSGNLLWIEAKRKQNRKKSGFRSDHFLYQLSVGVSLGCIAGISAVVAMAKLAPGAIMNVPAQYNGLYYLLFFVCVVWAFLKRSDAKKNARNLLYFCAAVTALIPLASLLSALGLLGWNHGDHSIWVDLVACVFVTAFCLMALKQRPDAATSTQRANAKQRTESPQALSSTLDS